MITVSHIWVTRRKCTCGYIWTNPGSPNVICTCGQTQIVDNVPVGGEAVTDDADFKSVVAQGEGVHPDELALIQG